MLSVVSMLLPEELTAAFPVARPFLVVLIGAMVSLEMECCVRHDKSTRYVMKAVEFCWKLLAGSVLSKSDRRYREDTMKQDQFCFYRERRKSHRLRLIRCLV